MSLLKKKEKNGVTTVLRRAHELSLGDLEQLFLVLQYTYNRILLLSAVMILEIFFNSREDTSYRSVARMRIGGENLVIAVKFAKNISSAAEHLHKNDPFGLSHVQRHAKNVSLGKTCQFSKLRIPEIVSFFLL